MPEYLWILDHQTLLLILLTQLPTTPKLKKLSKSYQQQELEVRGNTQAGARVKLMINNREEEVVANSEGQFSFIVKLNKGKNQFYAYAIDSAGNESSQSQTITIEFDDEPPELEIIKPEDGAEFVGL
jgi:hypothetical protein